VKRDIGRLLHAGLGRRFVVCLVLLCAWGPPAVAAAADGPALVRTYCSGCHEETSPGYFNRISNLRKTPEGWVMTLFRMRQVHGLALPEDVRDAIVRSLADSQGLAPSESAAGRFALERRPNVPDLQLEGDTNTMCARCHTAARISLQRRDADEWLKLVHMHVGQWPTLEYQASARDRFWWQVATKEIPARLAAIFPLETKTWKEWRARPRADLSGEWIVTGHTPGRGDYSGTAMISGDGAGGYTAAYRFEYGDGAWFDGRSKAIVYTGYEWRGTSDLGGQDVREVFALDESGNRLRGRWFLAAHSESGGEFVAERAGGAPRIVAVSPAALRIGTTQAVTLIGVGLDGAPDFGPGTTSRVVARDAHRIVVEVAVDADAAAGLRPASVGAVKGATPVALYQRIERITVEPSYAIARVGGGKVDPVAAHFEAIGHASVPGADGRAVDVRLGALPARWETAPFNEQAARDRDPEFTGRIDASGRFLPAVGGPNPARRFSGNNVGNLSVVAKVSDGAREVTGTSHLIVTVQRWNTPPIY